MNKYIYNFIKYITIIFYSIIFVYFIFLLVGCKTTKKISENKIYQELDSNYIEKIKEINNLLEKNNKETYVLQDSLIYIKGLLEKSKTIGLDSSFLETSYTWSIAKINKEGKLEHYLQNKDSIPSKILKEKSEKSSNEKQINNINSTEKQQKIKKIYYTITKTITIKEKLSFFKKFKYIGIGILIEFGILIIALIIYYKKHS